jgi:hypothetical protein
MTHQPGPARITIDFHDSLHPARGWIVGIGDPSARVELIAFAGSDGGAVGAVSEPDGAGVREVGRDAPGASSRLLVAADGAGCTCPEFCLLDHANE